MAQNPAYKELLPHLFRQEYAKMTAVLCRHFGLKHIEIAEDIASDTFLKASEQWAIDGIPSNPVAWLYTVAKNKAKDYFKHESIFESKVKNGLTPGTYSYETGFEFNHQIIADSQLAMIFAVCNPANTPESQICLALQILCGFSVEEIANAFLSNNETIKKRLYRARANLRNNNFQIHNLGGADIEERLEVVLKTLYLLFNEGYYSKSGNQVIRGELCSEAIRLAVFLSGNPLTLNTKVQALIALMYYQSSRLSARTGEHGEVILFDNQDRRQWDSSLIAQGHYYLVNACTGEQISKYHLEAGIAYWHTTPADQNKWPHILQLYNQLILVEYSPITALNRLFAYAKVYGAARTIPEAEQLQLTDIHYYHELLGYLYTEIDTFKAIEHYENAIQLTKSPVEREMILKELGRLREEKI
ncbi:RNA polymerase sigma factor [Chitinophaga caeni]|nr:DUF6596 domain-containing protein [Chitinophaga caeni]